MTQEVPFVPGNVACFVPRRVVERESGCIDEFEKLSEFLIPSCFVSMSSSGTRIGTHGGPFHADEVLGQD